VQKSIFFFTVVYLDFLGAFLPLAVAERPYFMTSSVFPLRINVLLIAKKLLKLQREKKALLEGNGEQRGKNDE